MSYRDSATHLAELCSLVSIPSNRESETSQPRPTYLPQNRHGYLSADAIDVPLFGDAKVSHGPRQLNATTNRSGMHKGSTELITDGGLGAVGGLLVILFLFATLCVIYNHKVLELTLLDSIYFAVNTPLGGMGPGDFNYPVGISSARPVGCILMIAGSLIVTINIGAFCTYIQREITNKSERSILREIGHMGGPYDPLTGVTMNDLINHSSRTLYLNTIDLVLRVFLYYTAWLIVGSVGMNWIEHYDMETSVYWACQMMSGAGMGDVVPVTQNGKLFASCWLIIAIYITLERITASSVYFQTSLDCATEVSLLKKAMLSTKKTGTVNTLNAEIMNQSSVLKVLRDDGQHRDHDGITSAEFALWLAVESKQLSPQFMVKAMAIFKRLDQNKDGYVYTEGSCHP